jgi:small subunit ribosomal protein S1
MSNSRKNTDYIDELNKEYGADDSTEESSKNAEKEDFASMLGESLKRGSKKLSVGDKIRGKILVLGKEDVFVSTGGQHDGVISRRDLNEPDGTCLFKQDDLIELYVTQVRGSDIRLSRKPTDKNLAEDLEDAFDMMLPIQGRIVEVCKGGVRVNVKGKLAFCPISQIDVKHVENAEEYVGKSFEFQITKFEEGGRNIVVSRRKLLQEERDLNAGSFLEENKDGDVVQGKVARLEKFGVFVELAPGVD